MQVQEKQLQAEYEKLLYDYAVPVKAKRQRLRELEKALVQFANLKIGDVFYTSWGYDQTQNDFLEIVSISPTKKTVMCQMLGKNIKSTDCVTCDNASPDKTRKKPTVFRLVVSYYNKHANLRGKYPFIQRYWHACKLADKEKAKGFFECPKIKTDEKNFFRWSEGRRSVYCKDCEHDYQELSVSYRKGSFSPYEKPLYETASGFGH